MESTSAVARGLTWASHSLLQREATPSDMEGWGRPVLAAKIMDSCPHAVQLRCSGAVFQLIALGHTFFLGAFYINSTTFVGVLIINPKLHKFVR